MPDTLKLQYMALNELPPALRNPNEHDLDGIEESLLRFGFVQPVVVDERTGRLVAGHGRVQVLKRMHANKAEMPARVRRQRGVWQVPVVRGWSSADDAEAEAYLLADNQLNRNSQWNPEGLYAMMADLASTAAGLAGTGFSPDDLADMIAANEAAVRRALDTPEPDAKMPSERNFSERAEAYADRATRSFVFDYPVPEYERISQACARGREELGVESNAALFAALVVERWA